MVNQCVICLIDTFTKSKIDYVYGFKFYLFVFINNVTLYITLTVICSSRQQINKKETDSFLSDVFGLCSVFFVSQTNKHII